MQPIINLSKLRIWGYGTVVLVLVVLIGVLYVYSRNIQQWFGHLPAEFYWFFVAGFVCAMIDGAIGMSYGVTSTSFSLTMGVPPAFASFGVHLSEILSNGIAGWMHYRAGNINWKLFKLLLIPGILGTVAGVCLLTSLQAYALYIKLFISSYTFVLACIILSKALNYKKRKGNKIKKIFGLGLAGGFADAIGGGGWATIVLSGLIAGGRNVIFSLGTVKIVRFFIAIISSLTFMILLNSSHIEAILGLVIGSALAAPIAAKVSNKISAKLIMVIVGLTVGLISLKSILMFIF